MKTAKATNEATELRRRADKVNNLLQNFAKMSGEASKVLGKLSGISSELDSELQNFIAVLEGMDNSEEGVTSLRLLKAANGLNLRIASGVRSNLGRLKDTQKNSVIVS